MFIVYFLTKYVNDIYIFTLKIYND